MHFSKFILFPLLNFLHSLRYNSVPSSLPSPPTTFQSYNSPYHCSLNTFLSSTILVTTLHYSFEIWQHNSDKSYDFKTIVYLSLTIFGIWFISSSFPILFVIFNFFLIMKVPLREFSNWLADFDPATFKIEIPGQYAQAMNRAPVVGNHAMIGITY